MPEIDPIPAEPRAVTAEPASAPTDITAITATPSPSEEPVPVFDIHPAHHAATTWRDFFIHIATIVLGLLIAVGLEQVVEYFHHRNQRREVIDSVHEEARKDIPVIESNMDTDRALQAWYIATLDALSSAQPANGMVTVVLPVRPSIARTRAVTHASWPIAKSNGTAALLPEALAETYDRCETEADEGWQTVNPFYSATAQWTATQRRFNVPATAGAPLRLSLAARDGLADAVSHALSTTKIQLFWYSAWVGCLDGLLHDVQTREEMQPYIERRVISAPYE